ncbi:3'-5' exoribonuclease domain-containing protein [Vibrio sp. FJH11]
MQLYFDTEFTSLTQQARLLSLAFVDQNGREFYAEVASEQTSAFDPWIREHVISNMYWLKDPDQKTFEAQQPTSYRTEVYHNVQTIATQLTQWLSVYDRTEIWADCPAYDWVLLCELFGGSLNLPKNVNYKVFDLATLLRVKGLDPDIERLALLPDNQHPSGVLHNAMYDAKLLKACVNLILD